MNSTFLASRKENYRQNTTRTGSGQPTKHCCYICLDDSVKSLTLIRQKLINSLRTFDLHIIENAVTPKYLCDSCRIDLTNSCELLSRAQEANKFWTKFSEKLGVAVKLSKPSRGTSNNKLKGSDPSTVFRCELCLETFVNRIQLNIHRWDLHLKNKEHPNHCPTCDGVFHDSARCRTHYYRYHDDTQESFGLCDKTGVVRGRIIDQSRVKNIQQPVVKIEPAPEYLDDDDTGFDPPSPADSLEDMSPVEFNENDESSQPVAKRLKTIDAFAAPTSKTRKKCPDCGEMFGRRERSKYMDHYWNQHARLEETPNVCRECNKEEEHEYLCYQHFFRRHFQPNYTCEFCSKSGMTFLQLRSDHGKRCLEKRKKKLNTVKVKNESPDPVTEPETEQDLICTYCNEKMPDNDRIKLFDHMWKEHVYQPDSPTICSICQNESASLSNNRAHFFSNHFDTNHACTVCRQDGFSRAQLKEHQQKEHKMSSKKKVTVATGKSFVMDVCDFCGGSFRVGNKDYRKHVWTVHGRDTDPLRCNECCTVFPVENKAMDHFFSHHYRKTEVCDECGEGNMTKRELQNHKNLHNVERSRTKIQCPLCVRILNSEENFQRHMALHQTHKMKKTHMCAICGNYYPTAGALTNHTRAVHIKDNSYRCRFCDRGWPTNVKRLNHEIAKHTKLYPFKCKFCGAEFVQKPAIQNHINKKHLDEPATRYDMDTKYIIRQNGAENSHMFLKRFEKLQREVETGSNQENCESQYEEIEEGYDS